MRSTRTSRMLVAVTASSFIVGSALGAAAAPSTTTRVSVSSDGTQAKNMSGRFSRPVISGDGRYVAFDSIAPNLVNHDENRRADIFVHATSSGQTQRISVSTAGDEADGDSANPAIDGDGRHVAFDSTADNLVPNDTNQLSDVFVRDRVGGKTFRVSVGLGGAPADGPSFSAAISADGRFVAFVSDAQNLVPGPSGNTRHIYLRDLLTRTTERVSLATDETPANNSNASPSISADGRMVAFSSYATNLVPNDTNGTFDVFVRDRERGTTIRASVRTSGGQANAESFYAALSGDGRYVAFASLATNLVPDDTNDRQDVFLHGIHSGRTIRVSVAADGSQADGQSVGPGLRGGLAFGPAVNFDGSRIAFDSVATNLVPNDTNTCEPFYTDPPGVCPDVFVRDRAAGTTIRVSVSSTGQQGNGGSTDPSIDATGLAVVFFSAAPNLVPDDTNVCFPFFDTGTCPDIFEWEG